MVKAEFLSQLQEALEGNIPLSNINEHIQYYDSFFQESGKSQEEVCEELGDPRLIARTIIDSFVASKGPMADYYKEQARSEYSQSGRGGQEGDTQGEAWYDKLFRYLILGVVLIVVATVFVFLLQVAVSVVIPVMLVILAVKLCRDFFRRY